MMMIDVEQNARRKGGSEKRNALYLKQGLLDVYHLQYLFFNPVSKRHIVLDEQSKDKHSHFGSEYIVADVVDVVEAGQLLDAIDYLSISILDIVKQCNEAQIHSDAEERNP